MEVFAYYDCSPEAPANQAELLTFWERSWRNRGWTPRLITARHARRSKFYAKHKAQPMMLPLLALHAVGGGWLTPVNVMNFDFPHCKGPNKNFVSFHCGMYQGSRAGLERFFRSGLQAHCSGWCSIYGETFWLKSPLVSFANPEDILNCGRVL